MRTLLLGLLLLHVVGVELALLPRVGAAWVPDVAAILVVHVVVSVREARVLAWFVPIALGRALLVPGSFVYWMWLLLVSWSVLLPFRRRFFPDRWPFQLVATFAIAMASSLVGSQVLASGAGDPLGRGLMSWFVTALVSPGVLLVLRAPTARRSFHAEVPS